MKTANAILTLIHTYAVDYHDGYHAKATANRLVKLRASIEELAKDAERYRFVKASKIHSVCFWGADDDDGYNCKWRDIDEKMLDADMKGLK